MEEILSGSKSQKTTKGITVDSSRVQVNAAYAQGECSTNVGPTYLYCAVTTDFQGRKTLTALIFETGVDALSRTVFDLARLDRWLPQGSSATTTIRPFLRWATRGGLMAPLTAPTPAPRWHADPLDSETRLLHLRRLLGDEDLDLRDRVGGCLLLLYGQPISRILMLTRDRVSTTGQRVVIQLGNTPLELPEPLGQLTARLAHQTVPRASTAAAATTPPWLFPGMRLGAPLDESYLRRRLKRLGITTLPARTAALITLAATLPPTIRADLLGISEGGASNWYQLASGEWAHYAADKTRRSGASTIPLAIH